MTSSKLYFVALLIILSALVSSVQSIRIMDASSDCDFRGPCKKKEDCYARCEVDRPPFNNATCVHKGSSRQCCCILS
ncbi:putative defensin-like protein 271 [Brassica rapa]|nr:putative defensin-like protein 271 [Brassica rapa]XP_022546430.1 putative defensin-like protein 271 [Brassica napus]